MLLSDIDNIPAPVRVFNQYRIYRIRQQLHEIKRRLFVIAAQNQEPETLNKEQKP